MATVISAQDHWGMDVGDAGPPRGHVHTEIDLESLPDVWTGKVLVPVTFIFFQNPGKVKEIDVRGRRYTDGSDFNIPTPQDTLPSAFVPSEHEDDMGVAMLELEVEVDSRLFPYDGWQQVRFAPIIKFSDAPGHEMRAILRLAINVKNGHPKKDWYDKREGHVVSGVEGVGFYVPTGYARCAIRNLDALYQPVGDTLELDVDFAPDSCARCEDKGHPNKAPLIRSVIRLDANVHMGEWGTQLWKADGEFQGIVSLDLSGVEPGEHKLMLRCQQPDDEFGSTNAGVLVVPFLKA